MQRRNAGWLVPKPPSVVEDSNQLRQRGIRHCPDCKRTVVANRDLAKPPRPQIVSLLHRICWPGMQLLRRCSEAGDHSVFSRSIPDIQKASFCTLCCCIDAALSRRLLAFAARASTGSERREQLRGLLLVLFFALCVSVRE